MSSYLWKRVLVRPSTSFLIITVAITLLIGSWVGSYQYQQYKAWWNWKEYVDNRPALEAQSKIIVMGKMQRENTDWVSQELPDWQTAIYTVDNATAPLHTPMNKGKEAMAYLTYIIDNYATLPNLIVFIHSHRFSPKPIQHNDAWNFDSVRTLKSLQLHHVIDNGYINLRCVPDPGCKLSQQKTHIHITPEIWSEVFSFDGSVDSLASFPEDGKIGVACCAQFAVSKEAVRRRKLEEYIHFRQWLIATEFDDERSGRVFEYLWHVIFGKGAVYCPERKACYCSVFGRC